MIEKAALIGTDTATICIFDLEAMRHRKDDVGDWWSLPRNELAEVRSGNALFLNLGSDGNYRVEVSQLADPTAEGYCLNTPSRRVFIGAGEEMSGGGFEPTGEWGGLFIDVNESHQKVSVTRTDNTLAIKFQAAEAFENDVADLINL
jgi:hypothetical protein